MEINQINTLGDMEQSCLTCQGYNKPKKTSRGGIVEWVIHCDTRNENVNVDGSVGKLCSQYITQTKDGVAIKCHKI